jgi:hypothetical protein
MNNKEKITSYYFEQNIQASYGSMLVKTWYADGWLKIVSIFPGEEEHTEYFDCNNLILIDIQPSPEGDVGWVMTMEPGDQDIPRNHAANDYHQYKVVDTDSIDGQTCRVLESRQGEKLWVSTKHGFPMQVEYNDPTNDEHFVIFYENLTFNQTSYEEVAYPEDLTIIEY